MKNNTILLYTNPEFDRRLRNGISKLYQIFFIENNIKVQIINKKFLKTHTPKENELLVIAGGDGTIHKAINSIRKEHLSRYIFGIIPAGTANEFAKSIGLPKSIEEAARIITKHSIILKQQIGQVNSKYLFLTGVLYGMADYALKSTPKLAKYHLKGISYTIGAIKLLLKLFKNQNKYQKKFLVNKEKHKTSYLLINNASLTSKDIEKEDLEKEDLNNFSVIFIKSNISYFDLLRLQVKQQLHKDILKDKKLNFSQHKEITLDFDQDINLLLDGEEYNFTSHININHFHKAISIITG